MATAVILPKFGFTLESSKLVRWIVNEGDKVREGDPLCEVETDKVNMEVEATADGVVAALQYPAGADVPVTNVICYILKPNESPEGLRAALTQTAPVSVLVATASDSTSSPAFVPQTAALNASPLAARMAEEHGIDLAMVSGTGAGGKITRADVEAALARQSEKPRATPAARRIASEKGIDLKTVTGSGPMGRIQGTDVAAAAALMTAQVLTPTSISVPIVDQPVSQQPTDASSMPYTIVKLEGMRRTIATRMQQSFQQAPHTFFEISVNTAGVDDLRAKLKARNEKLSVTSILVKACAWTLTKHPYLNATLTADEIKLWSTYNIGVAVALDNGLIVPVVARVETQNLRAIQTQIDDLAARARSNALRLPDLADGTFTISNLGMYGIDRFTAIINPPQVAILAVGRAVRQFVPDDMAQPMLQSRMSLTLSTDHRVVDGAQAAAFMADLRTVLEDPLLLVW
jgi:pyruvate dehydrogenase E2 component (dihydrolipoamide acetyltransferase)